MDTNEAKATFYRIKNACVGTITNFFKKRNISELPFGEWGFSDTPIIINGVDDYDTFTLDRAVLTHKESGKTDKVWLDCSSCDSNESVSADKLPIELLVNLTEWLQDNEEEIDEYLAEESGE